MENKTQSKHYLTFGRSHAKLKELLRVLNRVLHKLLELALHALKATNVVPGDVGDLNYSLAKSRRIGCAQRKAEVFHCDSQQVKHFGIKSLLLKVDKVHALSNLLQCGLGAKSCQIRADIAVGLIGNLGYVSLRHELFEQEESHLFQINIISQTHVLGVDAQDLKTADGIRNANVDLAIKAAETAQCL